MYYKIIGDNNSQLIHEPETVDAHVKEKIP